MSQRIVVLEGDRQIGELVGEGGELFLAPFLTGAEDRELEVELMANTGSFGSISRPITACSSCLLIALPSRLS